MRIVVAMGLAIGLFLGADSVQGDDALQGTWKLIGGEVDGKALSEQELQDGKLIIEGDHYRVTLYGKGTVTGEQKLDPAGKIKTIDITDASSASTCLGIYELEGNEFRVTFAPPGKARPTKMSPTPDSGSWTHVWKRTAE